MLSKPFKVKAKDIINAMERLNRKLLTATKLQHYMYILQLVFHASDVFLLISFFHTKTRPSNNISVIVAQTLFAICLYLTSF